MTVRPYPSGRLFDAYLAVDWSASSVPKRGKDSIWLCLKGEPPENPSTRHEAMQRVREQLGQLVAEGRRVLVGFDFPYGYPSGFAKLVAPDGLLILSTLSRTWQAWLFGVVAAERMLRWLPAGTHDWRRFVRPSEMARHLRAHGLTVTAITGMSWDPATDGFRTVRDTSVNYTLVARRL